MQKRLIFLVMIIGLISSSESQSGWTIQSSPTAQNMYGVSFIDANTWIAVGDGGTILRSSNGGINWVTVTSPVVDALRGVCMHGSLGIAVGISGRIVRTTNGGVSWIEITRPTTRNLYSVSISDNMSVAVGHEGTILVSLDNGLTWNPHTAGTASILFGVSVNSTYGVAVGGQGAITMSVNGGNGWGLTVLGGQTTFFYGTSFVNALTGWAVGSTASPGNVIIRSDNGGFVWTGETAPTTEQLFGVSFPALDTGTAVGGTGTIIHTVNGGTNWVSQTSGTTQILNGVSFANTSLGIAAGNLGTILRTSNGGFTAVGNNNNSLPSRFGLSQNYPNPFNPSTRIDYQIPKNSYVRLFVYDAIGSVVKELVNQQQSPGSYSVEFDGKDLATGMYFFKLETGSFSETKKMMLIK